MNLVVRRRLAAGALLSSSALVAGLLLAPSSNAASGGLQVIPSSVVNTDAAAAMSYKSSNVDFTLGSTETFSRIGGGQPFTASTGRQTPPADSHTGTGTKDFTDVDGSPTSGGGVGVDGPADAGVYNVSVSAQSDPTGQIVTGGTDSCTSCFTVLPAGAVSVTGATPTSYRPGATGNITIAGNNFERGSHVDFLFSDGSVDPLITANANPKDYTKTGNPDVIDKITTRKSLMRTAHVDNNDAPGARGMRITNLDGNTASCTACFFVAGPALSSISPTGGVNDPGSAPVTVTFSGSNVTANGTPRLEYTGNPGGSTRDALSLDPISSTRSTGTSITGTFDLSNAAPGTYQGVVRDPATGITNACEQPACSLFTVVQQSNRKPPTVTGLDRDPNTTGNQKDQQAGTTQVFNVLGTNFSKGVAIKTTATKTTVTAVEFVSPTLVKATIVTAKDETAGDYDVTATLTDGTASAACAKCYTVAAAQSTASPSPSSGTASASPCPTASSSASGSPSASSSASASPSATSSTTASPSASASTTASPSATTSPTALPIPAFAAATPSATSTATVSPSGSPSASGCPSNRQTATLTAERDTISAGQKALLHGSGAPGQAYSLQCYTRPSVNYSEARSGTFDSAGNAPTFELNLGRNTRCYLRYASNPTQGQSPSIVINVNTVLSLSTVRKAAKTYEFRGRNLPRVAGQLITLYRVDAAGNEIRTSNLKTDNTGIYKVTRKFSGTGTFRFLVRTSKTNDNAPGHSNTITVTVR